MCILNYLIKNANNYMQFTSYTLNTLDRSQRNKTEHESINFKL